jgi:hypothetical protein
MYQALLEEIQTDSEKEAWFEERTKNHIEAVQSAAKKIVDAYPELSELTKKVADHDASKLVAPERAPYIELTWKHKHDDWKGYKTPGTIDDNEINRATLHHIKSNDHHPEYWNKEEANVDPKDRDKSVTCLDATKMPPVAIAEMVADWQAMAEELKKNTAREWFNKTKDVRWHFTEEQVALIDKLLKVFEV